MITPTAKKSSGFLRKLIWIFALLLILFLAWCAFVLYANYSTGMRAGTVMKISKKGYVFKTYEGQLNLGLVQSNENIWSFSVPAEDTAVVHQIEHAAATGKRVSLHYDEKYYQYDWAGETKYFVNKVEEVK